MFQFFLDIKLADNSEPDNVGTLEDYLYFDSLCSFNTRFTEMAVTSIAQHRRELRVLADTNLDCVALNECWRSHDRLLDAHSACVLDALREKKSCTHRTLIPQMVSMYHMPYSSCGMFDIFTQVGFATSRGPTFTPCTRSVAAFILSYESEHVLS